MFGISRLCAGGLQMAGLQGHIRPNYTYSLGEITQVFGAKENVKRELPNKSRPTESRVQMADYGEYMAPTIQAYSHMAFSSKRSLMRKEKKLINTKSYTITHTKLFTMKEAFVHN